MGKIPPTETYNLWLITFIIPFALLANIIFLVVSVALRKKSSLYYIVTLLIGSNYLISTVGVKSIFNRQRLTKDTFTVLSYNMQSLGGHYAAPASFRAIDQRTLDFKEWILQQESEIQCYQEFLNYDDHVDFNIIQQLHNKGYHTYFSYDSGRVHKSLVVGTLITSKYPIASAGDIIVSENGFNRATYADIVMDSITLRVINVHLESMGIKQYHPAHSSGFQSRKESAKIILHKLKDGVFERSHQVKILAKFIKESPYPVICVGDFNDMPYSYSYQYLKRRMRNTFEEVGTGFGFTYNGNTLRMLRIDNQFFSDNVKPVRFITRNDIEYSDHFPLEAVYKIDLP